MTLRISSPSKRWQSKKRQPSSTTKIKLAARKAGRKK